MSCRDSGEVGNSTFQRAGAQEISLVQAPSQAGLNPLVSVSNSPGVAGGLQPLVMTPSLLFLISSFPPLCVFHVLSALPISLCWKYLECFLVS